jgi:hypothetical protein
MNRNLCAFLVIIFCITATAGACIFSKETEITFENQSNIFIDSVVVNIQNYSFTLKDIKPNSLVYKKIPRDSIRLNKHDIMIRTILFDKEKSNFQGGFYYNDLSGELRNSYTITLNNNLIATIKAK